jgi:C_GCAxxG_C_C family probable redox protein
MDAKVKLAVERFKKGFNCSQAVLGSYSEQFGLDCSHAFKLAAGFGGGMRMGQTCGAVTGAFMVLGLKYGSAAAKDQRSKAKTNEKISEYISRFKARNGSLLCKELLGCDISRSEGMKKAQKKGLFDSVCPKMVQDAAEILEDLLMQDT